MHNAVNLFRDLFNGNTYGGGTGDYQLRVDGLPRPSWAAKALSERRRSSWRFLLAWERQRGRRSPGRLIVQILLEILLQIAPGGAGSVFLDNTGQKTHSASSQSHTANHRFSNVAT